MPARIILILGWGCLVAANAATVGFTTIDPDLDKPVPCRIHLTDSAGKSAGPVGLPFWHDHFVCGGAAELDLAAGTYRYQIERGPEYAQALGSLTVGETSGHSMTNHLRRLVNLSREGWWSGELHVHRPMTDVELLMQAEDLHVVPVITWWNNNNPWANRALPPDTFVRFDRDRFYHLLGGEDERGGGALLFFNSRQPLNITGSAREFPSASRFLAEARKHAGVWVDIEKPFWLDAPLWLASGQADSIGIANNHMHRGGMLTNEAWGRPRDRQRLPDPHGNGSWTQELYYHVLNSGLRLPPSAGSASGVLPNPVGYNRVYVQHDGELTYESWWQGFKAGRVFVSNGPLLRCRANRQWPGYVFKTSDARDIELKLEATLDSRDPIRAIEVIQNGRVVRSISPAEWKRTRSLGTVRFHESGWCLVRVIADVPETFRFASTGPFYVEIGSSPHRISKASAQFFLEWVRERAGQIKLNDPRQQDDVMQFHRAAEMFWQGKLAQANTE